jgi:hypothetical protein
MSQAWRAAALQARAGSPQPDGNAETMKAISPGSFRSADARMACGWQDLPFRAADAYRHNRKLIGAVCWSGRALPRR